MVRNILIAWTILASVATLVIGIWVSFMYLAAGILLIVLAMMLLGIGIALVLENTRRRYVARPEQTAVVTTQVRQHKHKGRSAVRAT